MRTLALFLSLLTAICRPLSAARPWDEAFSKDTRAIAEAAGKVTAASNPGAIVLLEDHQFLVHADGRTDHTIRKVFRILDKDALEDWSGIEQGYQPWHQQKPEMRARVIQPDGSFKVLEASTVADSPALEFDSSVYSDSRVARAPLPGVAAGVVVEYEVTVRDKAPLLDAGVTHRVVVSDYTPMERFHVTVRAESGVHLRLSSKLIPESALRRESDAKGTSVECELAGIEPRKNSEYNLPPDESASPYLSFSNGASWQAVATRYETIVNQRIQNADLKALMAGIELQGKPEDVAARLTAKLHATVRYTGVEFGEAAIIPATPAETLGRGYGDCKDKAALLVAMLRAAGIGAEVALLNSGFSTDVDPDLPGLGMFDHAIVYVATNPPLWIDATADRTRVGTLPSGDQGRLALIANRETTSLKTTPEAKPAENWRRTTAEVRMSELGAGVIEEVQEAGGEFETTLRGMAGSDQKVKEQLAKYVKTAYAAKALGKFEAGRTDDWSRPFRVTLEALQAATVNTGTNDAGVALLPARVFEDLPYALTGGFGEKDETEKAKTPRKRDFIIAEPYHAEYRYKIHPPRLYKATTAPAEEDVRMGPAVYRRSLRANADGTFEVSYSFDIGKRRLTAEEFEAMGTALKKYNTPANEVIIFVPETSEYMALGQTGKAIALLRADAEQHKDSAMARARLATVLLAAGLGDAALREAKIAAELDPKSGVSWRVLGTVYEHDTFGRPSVGNWNQAEAEKTFRKALEIDPDDVASKAELAVLLEFNPKGERYAKDARLDESIAMYRELLKKQANPNLEQNLSLTLLRAGRYDEAKVEAKKTPEAFQALLLGVIAAVQETPTKAIISAQSSYPDARQRAIHLSSVAMTIMQLREYRAAQAVMAAAARTLSAPEFQSRAEMLAKLKRWEDVMLPDDDPSQPIQRLLVESFKGNFQKEAIKRVLTKRADVEAWAKDAGEWRSVAVSERRDLTAAGLPGEVLVDMIASMLEFEKEGTPETGYRINVKGPQRSLVMFVAREDGQYRIVGIPPDGMDVVGELALECLDKNDLKGARWWLDQTVNRLEASTEGTGFPAVLGLWSGITEQTRGPVAIRVAAAALIGSGKGSKQAIETLQDARAKAPTALEKAQVDKAICESLAKAKRWEELVAAAQRLGAHKTFTEEGFRYFIRGASGAGKWKELEAEALKRVTANPLNLAAIRALVLAMTRQGKFAGGAEWARKMRADSLAGTSDRVLASWALLAAGKPEPETLAALKKDTGGPRFQAKYYYAVAILNAALDQPDEGRQALIEGLNREDYEYLDVTAWAAYGKICEQYGYSADAEVAFGKAREAGTRDPQWAEWILPLLRLKAEK